MGWLRGRRKGLRVGPTGKSRGAERARHAAASKPKRHANANATPADIDTVEIVKTVETVETVETVRPADIETVGGVRGV